MVEGVTNGFEKRLEIQGVGYRAALSAPISSSRSATRTRSGSCRAPGSSSRCPCRRRCRARDRQADGRPDRGRDPQGAPAGAVQGQGHPLRGRARPPEGRKARMSTPHRSPGARAPSPPRARQGRRRRRAAPPRGLPLEPRRLRAARRRLERQDARRRELGHGQGHRGQQDRPGPAVGQAIAEAAKKVGVEAVVFDRGGYLYHGRVKALAEGAREGGLRF